MAFVRVEYADTPSWWCTNCITSTNRRVWWTDEQGVTQWTGSCSPFCDTAHDLPAVHLLLRAP